MDRYFIRNASPAANVAVNSFPAIGKITCIRTYKLGNGRIFDFAGGNGTTSFTVFDGISGQKLFQTKFLDLRPMIKKY